MTGLEAAL
jgi:hypothetical protein